MSLININTSFNVLTSIWFSELLLCLLFKQNNEPKIIIVLKKNILGWQNLLPINSLWQVCLSGVFVSNLLCFEKSQHSLVDESLREKIYDNWVPFGESVFKGSSEKSSLCFLASIVFQVSTAQINQYTKVECFGATCSELLHSYFEMTYSAVLQYHYHLSPQINCPITTLYLLIQEDL